MTLLQELPCWEIMQCEEVEECPVWQRKDGTPCWETVKKLGDYRSSYEICNDCLVYLLKNQARLFSDQEIRDMTEVRCDQRGAACRHLQGVAL